MTRSPAEQRVYLISIVFAALPFAVALYYAFTHDADNRYLWIAFGTFAGVAIIMAVARVRARPRRQLPWIAVPATALGALVGVAAAYWLVDRAWASGSTAVWASILFASSWAVSHVLDTLSRPLAKPTPSIDAPNA